MTNVGPEGPSTGNPAGFMAGYIAEGRTSSEALSEYRSAGGRIRTQTWYRTWGQVADTLARADQFLALNPDLVPSPESYGTWAMGKGGQYATQVSIMIRDRDTGLLRAQNYTLVTNDPHTPAQAQDIAEQDFTEADQEATYGEQVVGSIATRVWQTVPYEP